MKTSTFALRTTVACLGVLLPALLLADPAFGQPTNAAPDNAAVAGIRKQAADLARQGRARDALRLLAEHVARTQAPALTADYVVLLAATGDAGEAIRYYEMLPAGQEQSLDVMKAATACYRATRSYEKARALCEKILSKNPTDEDTQRRLVLILFELAQPKEACALLDRIVASQAPGAAVLKPSQTNELDVLLAQARSRAPAEAAELLGTALRISHGAPAVRAEYVLALIRAEKHAEAVREYEQLPGDYPQSPALVRALACEYGRTGAAAKAVPLCRRIVRDDPADVDTTRLLANLLLQTNDAAGAAEAVRLGLVANADNIDLLLLKAEMDGKNGRPDEGLRTYDRILALQPRNKAAGRRRVALQGEVDRLRAHRAAASTEMTRAKADPSASSSQEARRRLAMTLFERGKYEEAARQFIDSSAPAGRQEKATQTAGGRAGPASKTDAGESRRILEKVLRETENLPESPASAQAAPKGGIPLPAVSPREAEEGLAQLKQENDRIEAAVTGLRTRLSQSARHFATLPSTLDAGHVRRQLDAERALRAELDAQTGTLEANLRLQIDRIERIAADRSGQLEATKARLAACGAEYEQFKAGSAGKEEELRKRLKEEKGRSEACMREAAQLRAQLARATADRAKADQRAAAREAELSGRIARLSEQAAAASTRFHKLQAQSTATELKHRRKTGEMAEEMRVAAEALDKACGDLAKHRDSHRKSVESTGRESAQLREKSGRLETAALASTASSRKLEADLNSAKKARTGLDGVQKLSAASLRGDIDRLTRLCGELEQQLASARETIRQQKKAYSLLEKSSRKTEAALKARLAAMEKQAGDDAVAIRNMKARLEVEKYFAPEEKRRADAERMALDASVTALNARADAYQSIMDALREELARERNRRVQFEVRKARAGAQGAGTRPSR